MKFHSFLAVSTVELCILLLQLGLSSTASLSDEYRLRAKILKNYDNYTRPVQNGFDVKSSNTFNDEHRNIITLQLFTVMTWVDEHVKWDPLNYGDLFSIAFSPLELWRPEISVMNKFDESEIDPFGNTLIMTLFNSVVWWVPLTKFQVHCPFDFRLWPYDTQTCQVVISSWTHHAAEIDFIIPENATKLVVDDEWQEDYTENREWKLVGSSVERSRRQVYCCPELPLVEVVELFITVEIQRRCSTHTAAITVVGLGIAAVVLISFWLDPFAQERLPLTPLILFLNSIYLQYLHMVIPNNGSSVPLSIAFFRNSLIMVAFATAWIVKIRCIAKRTWTIHDFLDRFLKSSAASVLCLNLTLHSKGEAQRKQKEISGDNNEDLSELVGHQDCNPNQENWALVTHCLDRIAFFVYAIAYTVFIAAFL